MRRVIFNQKGGVGKSSITCNLAAISAAAGLKTLVVDLDVQGNTSHYLGFDFDGTDRNRIENTVAELLKQTAGFFKSSKTPDAFVHDTEYEDLYLLPSSPALEQLEKELESRYKIYKLRDALNTLEKDFDRIYIDTPPNFNFYSKSALIAANSVLIPFDCDNFSRQALYTLMGNLIELQEDHNPNLQIEGIIVNQFNNQANLPKTLIAEMQAEGLPMRNQFIGSSIKMKESHHLQRPLVDLAPRHKLTQQFLALYNELEEEVFQVDSEALSTLESCVG